MSLPFTLHPLTPPVGSRAVPAEFDEAAAIFARAQAAYERGAYREAAGLFLSTAGALHVEGDYAEACTAGRTVSYWNAILATLAAGDADGAAPGSHVGGPARPGVHAAGRRTAGSARIGTLTTPFRHTVGLVGPPAGTGSPPPRSASPASGPEAEEVAWVDSSVTRCVVPPTSVTARSATRPMRCVVPRHVGDRGRVTTARGRSEETASVAQERHPRGTTRADAPGGPCPAAPGPPGSPGASA